MTDRTDEGDSFDLALYAEKAYLEYAMSVVKGRALPDVADGQKPVQRRILYAMRDMGLTAGAKPVKSARVVGEILGKYHPHGDSSSYEAMVRMAQSFSMRYPLVDGVGNFGSRDGDGPAAMRYTEARLTPISELLLSELNMGTVPFVPNYDGAFSEPSALPARLPFVLLNGASGIAVGMATEIPSHNLGEIADLAVAMLSKPDMTVAQCMRYVPGPDFHSGARIIDSKAEIQAIYETGKGNFRTRCRYKVERLARGQWQAVVEELPPNVSTQKILSQIDELADPKPKSGKKNLSREQLNAKALLLSYVERVRDESDGEHPVRIVIEPKTSKIGVEDMMNALMAQTDLETNVPANLVAIGRDGKPQQKNLAQIMGEWIEFRLETIANRLSFRLDAVKKRAHILEGRQIVFLSLDDVIQTIRDSDDPKADLMGRFGLTEAQSDDILEIRLRQLAKMEWIKLERELNQLKEETAQLTRALGDERLMRALMAKEIKEDRKKYADPRRTEIKEEERSALQQAALDEPLTIVLSRKGWIRARAGHDLGLETLTFKVGDGLLQTLECRSVDDVALMDDLGRSYRIDPAALPKGRGDGVPLSSLAEIKPEASPLAMMGAEPEREYFLCATSGYGFIVRREDLSTRLKAGKQICDLDEGLGARMLPPIPIPIGSGGAGGDADAGGAGPTLALCSDEPRLLAFPLGEVKRLKRGKGLQLMRLGKGASLRFAAIASGRQIELSAVKPGGKIGREKIALASIAGKRGSKGRPIALQGKPDGLRDCGAHAAGQGPSPSQAKGKEAP